MMISGWKQTGKDFLFNKIKNNDLSDTFWVSQTQTAIPDFKEISVKRYAFADEVKSEIPNYKESEKSFFRNQCIEHAEKMKLEFSESYWADKVANKINTDKNSFFIVTDFRFPIEHTAIKKMFPSVLTARVFRSGVEIPTHETEHKLDNYSFDYFIFFNIKDISDFLVQNSKFKLVYSKQI